MKQVLNLVLVYDDTCGLCNNWINWIKNKYEKIKIIKQSSKEFLQLPNQLKKYYSEINSIMVIKYPINLANEFKIYLRSSAIIEILKQINFKYKILAWILYLVPKFLRDWAYKLIANRRHKFFKLPEQCKVNNNENYL